MAREKQRYGANATRTRALGQKLKLRKHGELSVLGVASPGGARYDFFEAINRSGSDSCSAMLRASSARPCQCWGDYKYLKILDNTFLFNVVEDPFERANLKERHKDVYDRIVAEWHACRMIGRQADIRVTCAVPT